MKKKDSSELQRLEYLENMDISVWESRNASATSSPAVDLAMSAVTVDSLNENFVEPEIARPALVASLNWSDLQKQVAECKACPLHLGRTQTVFGVGNREAGWLVVGEAPGEQEDLRGEPFVGRAGQLLNEMLRAIGLDRESVYIANILKCRPPKNRDPATTEVACCEDYLKNQIALIKPSIILAVGRIAAQNLLKTEIPIGKLRGQVHNYQKIPLIVTYHPAYLLRAPNEKRNAWQDLKLARQTYKNTGLLKTD